VAPERFLGVEELLACADLPGIETSVAIDGGGRIVALFQVAREGCERAGMRSVALLVHPGRRGAGFGRATLLAALAAARNAGTVLLAVIDCENTASLRCFAACGFRPDDDADPGGYLDFIRRVPTGAEVGFRNRCVRTRTHVTG
jgi:GNAT superfamily N-acetyltransferase